MRLKVFISCCLILLGSPAAVFSADIVETVEGSTTVPGQPDPESAGATITIIPQAATDPDGFHHGSKANPPAWDPDADNKLAARWDFESTSSGRFPNIEPPASAGTTELFPQGTIPLVASGVSKAASLNEAYMQGSVSDGEALSGKFSVSLWFKVAPGTLDPGDSHEYQTLCVINDLLAATVSGQTVNYSMAVALGTSFADSGSTYISLRGLRSTQMYAAYGVSPHNGSYSYDATGEDVFYLNFPRSGVRLDDGQWHHLVVTYGLLTPLTAPVSDKSGGPFSVYLDGSTALQTDNVVSYTTTSLVNKATTINHQVVFGHNPANHQGLAFVGSYFRGEMDRIRMYGRTLNQGEVAIMFGQDIDDDQVSDFAEVADQTDPLDPNDPNPQTSTPANDDQGLTMTGIPPWPGQLARWDFERRDSNNRIEDLTARANDLTLSGPVLDNGHGMPSVSARFDGNGHMSKDNLDWGVTGDYSVSQWVRFEEYNDLANTFNKVVLWELDGVHGDAGKKLLFAAARSPQTGRELLVLTTMQAAGASGILWDPGFYSVLADGSWHHIALVRKLGTYSLFVDGAAIPAQAGTSGPAFSWNQNLDGTGMAITVGGFRGDAPENFVKFQGNIDRMRVWWGALAGKHVTKLYLQDFDGDTIPDITEINGSLDPLEPNTPDPEDASYDHQGLPANAANNLAAHWNFESFRYAGGDRYFENNPVENSPEPALYKMVAEGGVEIGTQNVLAGNYASFASGGSMEALLVTETPPLQGALDGRESWALGGWLRVERDSIWEFPGVPLPLWELNGISPTQVTDTRLYAIRAGEFTHVVYVGYNRDSGANLPDAARWILPRSLRLDDEGWHHVFFQRLNNTGGYALYIDGKIVTNYTELGAGPPTAMVTGATAKLRLGVSKFTVPYSTSRDFAMRGAWDRLRLYNTHVDAKIVESLYRQDVDSDGVPDIDEYGVPGRSATTPEGALPDPPSGLDLTHVDKQGVPPSLNASNSLLGLWDFEALADRTTGFADKSGTARPAMIPGGTAAQSGMDAHGMPSRSLYVRDGGHASAAATHFLGANEFTASVWVRTEPGYVERITDGFCLLSLEDLQRPADSNTLALRIRKPVGNEKAQSIIVGNYGTLSGFLKPTQSGAAWSLLDRRIDDGYWHHIAWVRTKQGSTVYMDGLPLSERINIPNSTGERILNLAKPEIASASPQLVVGKVSSRTTGLEMAGNIDRLRFYGKALSGGEVKSLYQQDFDGDGYADFFEFGRGGFDPFLPAEDGNPGTGEPAANWDDDTGLNNAAGLGNGLIGDWTFESVASPAPGDPLDSLRFPAQRPANAPAALAQGGPGWDLEGGMPSRAVALQQEGYLAFPAEIFGGGQSPWAASFWVRMDEDEIQNQKYELERSGFSGPYLRKIALLTFGTDHERLPHFVASVNGDDELVIDNNFERAGGLAGYSKDEMARWRLPAKLDDGRWHHIALSLSGTESKVFVDGFSAVRTSASAGTFHSFGSFTTASDPYLWIGFRKNKILSAENLQTSALPYRGFSGSIDRVRFYNRTLDLGSASSPGEVRNLYFQDRDGDTIPDITEANGPGDPLAAQAFNAADDHDGDGISSGDEVASPNGLDRWRPDSDGDWLWDGWEQRYATQPDTFKSYIDDSAKRYGHHDSDQLNGWQEFQSGTDPDDFDTDNDGFSDSDELRGGSSPTDPLSVPSGGLDHLPMEGGRLADTGSWVPSAPPGGAMSYSYNGSDATGPRFRKIALNGRPIADQAPETDGESDERAEETYVDAFSLGLHFDHSLIYVPLASSELVLQANLSLSQESWSNRSGIRPHERLTTPFGPCWSTNLCAYIEEVVERDGDPLAGPSTQPGITYHAIDEGGGQLRFGSYNGISIFPYPGSLSDRKSYQHKLSRAAEEGVLVLEKKFGTTLTYRKVDLDQWHLSNRAGHGSTSLLHRYYRLEKVEDRFGNKLVYSYPTSHNKTLIPNLIHDPARLGQKIEIEVDPVDPYRIVAITDPRGYSHNFGYASKSIELGTASGGAANVKVLTTITDPEQKFSSFSYEQVTERDFSTPSDPTFYYSLNLDRFTNKKNVSTVIGYVADDDKYSSSQGSGDATAKRIYGLPRLVKRVRSAASAPATLQGAGEVEQIAEFSRMPGLRWFYTASGVTVSGGITPGVPGGSWTNEIRDAESNVTRYVFRDIQSVPVDASTHGSSFSLDWMIYYTRMDIIHPGSVGTESYFFDLPSGLSLAKSIDTCGNSTVYNYGDVWGGVSVIPSSAGQLAPFSSWSDPTSKSDALGRTESYSYASKFRIMSSFTNVQGTKEEYDVDALGRRRMKTVMRDGSTILSKEIYRYDDGRFPNFMTSRTVVALPMEDASLQRDWMEDLITLYKADDWGRVELEVTDMNRNYEIDAAADLVTSYTYDKNGNKTSVSDPRQKITRFSYDPLNRLSVTTYPPTDGPNGEQNATSIRLYDEVGNVHATIDENQNVSMTLYDALNRKRIEIRDMDGGQIPVKNAFANVEGATFYRLTAPGSYGTADLYSEFYYNDVNSVVQVIDPRRIVTKTDRDPIQRPIAIWKNYTAGSSVATFGVNTDQELTTLEYDNTKNCGGSVFAGDSFKPTKTIKSLAVKMTPTEGSYSDVVTTAEYDGVYRVVKEQILSEPPTTTETSYNDVLLTQTVKVSTGSSPLRTSITRTDFDRLGRTVSVVRSPGDELLESKVSTVYSGAGMAFKTIDALRRETETDYDAAGRPTHVWQARNDHRVPGDAKFGKVDRENGLNDEVIGSPYTVTEYDAAGNIKATINPRGARTEFTYDARNRKILEVLPAVDSDGNPATSDTSHPDSETYYDPAGNVIKTVDPRGRQTLSFYDKANRVHFTRTDPQGVPSDAPDPTSNNPYDIVTENGYDANGNILWLRDGNGNYTWNTYDGLNRLVSTITNPSTGAQPDPDTRWYEPHADDIVVQNLYDDVGNLIRVTDGLGQVTEFNYDSLGHKTRVIWDANDSVRKKTETYTYDGLVMVSKTNADSREVKYSYDALLRRTGATYESPRTADNRTMTYDLADNLLSVTYPNETAALKPVRNTSQTYDGLNRLLTETSNGQTHEYHYDKAGNRTEVIYGGTGRYVKSTYDALNRLRKMRETDGTTVSSPFRDTDYWYDLAGNVTEKILPNGTKTVTTYDYLGRKLGITDRLTAAPDTVRSSFDYSISAGTDLPSGYDKVGNVLYVSESYTHSGVSSRFVTNVYDRTYRLGSEKLDESGAGGPINQTSYTYDKANNRTRMVKSGGTTQDTTYTYGNAGNGKLSNQLASYGPTGASTTHNFSYDAKGNRSNRTATGQSQIVYAYDDDNRLLTLTSGGNVQHRYYYDHRTRRVQKVEGPGGTAVTTNISFSGGQSVQERSTAGAVTRQYIRGSDWGGGVGGILYSMGANISTTPAYNHYNSRGDVVSQTDGSGSGAVLWQGAYGAFGKRVEQGGTSYGPQKANTKDEDPTELLNEGMRYRDLETGVFMTRDPAGFVDGPNVYTYVSQNPWSAFDPLGLDGADLRSDMHVARSVDVDYRQFQNERAGAQANATKQTAAGVSRVVDSVVSAVIVFLAANPNVPAASYSAALDPVRPINSILWNYDPVLEGTFLEYSPPTKEQALAQSEAMVELQNLAAAGQRNGNGRGPLAAKQNARGGGGTSKPAGNSAKDTAAETGPTEAYNRQKHYGKTPTAADRKAVGAGSGEVADHSPSLVERYYQGDPSINELPGYKMTPAERKASAGDRSRMSPQPRSDSNVQGAEKSRYSKEQKKKYGL